MSEFHGLQLVTLVVPGYDEALDFFVNTLGFELVEDTPIPEQNKRWVVVSPNPASGSQLLLAEARDARQRAAIGNQTGGRVGFFLHVQSLRATHQRLVAEGVEFEREPESQPYGEVAVMIDPWGNWWDLIEPHPSRVR